MMGADREFSEKAVALKRKKGKENMLDLSYWMPTRLFFGKGCVLAQKDYFKGLGKRCLIVTGKNGAKASGALQDVTDALSANSIAYEIFDEVEQNPLLSTCYRAGNKAKEMQADFLIGIGGGSPLDAVKTIAVFAANDLEPLAVYQTPYPNKPLPFVLVGTTAGTGSEVTPYSVITVDGEENTPGRKKTVKGLWADACFGDPTYTYSLSEKVTLSTALDALSHCLESYFSKKANTISALFATEGTKLILDVFFNLPQNGVFTPKQREQLYTASIYGGLAITQTGTCFAHAMSNFLVEEHGVPHGIACALFLPSFLQWSCEVEGKKADTLLSELDVSASELKDMIENLTDWKPIYLTQTQRNELYDRFVQENKFGTSPGEFTAEDALDLLEELFD